MSERCPRAIASASAAGRTEGSAVVCFWSSANSFTSSTVSSEATAEAAEA
jgi:hypothetical protein